MESRRRQPLGDSAGRVNGRRIDPLKELFWCPHYDLAGDLQTRQDGNLRNSSLPSIPTTATWPAAYFEPTTCWNGLGIYGSRDKSPLHFTRIIESMIPVWEGTYDTIIPLPPDTAAMFPKQVDTPAAGKIWNTNSNSLLAVFDRLRECEIAY